MGASASGIYAPVHNSECISTIASHPGRPGTGPSRGLSRRCRTLDNRQPVPERLELPPALVWNRTAARRPRPRDAAAHRGPDAALRAPGRGGVRPRHRHAGHHLRHPPDHQDDHRPGADRARAGGAGPRDRPAAGAGRGPLGRGRAAALPVGPGRHRRGVRPAQPPGPPPAGPGAGLPRPRPHRAAAGQGHLGRALAALLHLLGPGLHGPQRAHLRDRGHPDVAARAPALPGRAGAVAAAGLRGAALQPPPAPRLLAGAAGGGRADHGGRGGHGRGAGGQGVRARGGAGPPPGGRGRLDPRPEPGGGPDPGLLRPPAGHPAPAQPGRHPLVRGPAGHRRPDHPGHAGRLQQLPAAARLAAAGAGDAVRLRPAGRGQRRAGLRGARPAPGHRRPAGSGRPPGGAGGADQLRARRLRLRPGWPGRPGRDRPGRRPRVAGGGGRGHRLGQVDPARPGPAAVRPHRGPGPGRRPRRGRPDPGLAAGGGRDRPPGAGAVLGQPARQRRPRPTGGQRRRGPRRPGRGGRPRGRPGPARGAGHGGGRTGLHPVGRPAPAGRPGPGAAAAAPGADPGRRPVPRRRRHRGRHPGRAGGGPGRGHRAAGGQPAGQPAPGRAGGAAGPGPGGRPGQPRGAGRPRARLPGRARPRRRRRRPPGRGGGVVSLRQGTVRARRPRPEPAASAPTYGAPAEPGRDRRDRRSGRRARAWLWPLVRPHRGLVALASLAVLVQSGASLAMPYLVKVAIDRGVTPKDLEVIDRVALAYLALAGVQFLAGRVEIETVARVGQRVLYTVRTRLFRHLQTLSLDFYERERTGRLVARMTADIDAMSGLVTLVTALITMVGVAVILVAMDWELALATLVVAPLIGLAARSWRRWSAEAYRQVRETHSVVTVQLQESLAGVRAIQSFRRERATAGRLREANHDERTAHRRTIALASFFFPGIEFLGTAATVVVLGVGGRRVLAGDLEIGTLAAFLLYLRSLFDPVQQLSELYDSFQSATAGAERVGTVLAERPSVREAPDPVPLPDPRGDVRLEDVCFAYDQGAEVLHDVSLSVAAGTTLALIGPTGAGKSTVAKLIARFYDPQGGRVTLDGVDLRRVRLADLRRAMGYVPQEGFLFSSFSSDRATVADNIRFGRPSATRSEIEAAARAVGAE